jgi:hypothetical protein
VLARSNLPPDGQTANAETSAARLRQHRATGYAALEVKNLGNQETLETAQPQKLGGGLGNFHQQPFGLGVLDAIHQAAAFMHVAHSLGQGDAGLNKHHAAHREVALDPEIDRQKLDADGDQEGRGG